MRWSRTAALAGTALALSALTPLSAASATPLALDVVTAVNSPGTPPDVGRVDVTWTVGDPTGIVGFAVEVSQDGETWAAPSSGTCASVLGALATSCSAADLVVGTAYQVRVSALDEGSGVIGLPLAAAATVTPANAPGAPGSLLVSAGDQELSLTWAAPTSDGGASLIDYVLEYRVAEPVGDWAVFDDGAGTTATGTITGLVNGTPYHVRVSAANAIGAGPTAVSDAAHTPDATPPPSDPPVDPPVVGQPAAVAVTPAHGSTVSPTSVTITGTDLGGSNASATVSVGGVDATDVVVSEGGSSLTATFAPGTAGAQDVVVTTDQGSSTLTGGFFFADYFSLDNSAIRFGSGYQSSITSIGTLNQPWYYSPTAHQYYKLTFGDRQLEYAVGSGTGGGNWSGANVLENPSVTDLVVDYSRFVSTSTIGDTGLKGYGTVTTTGTLDLNGQQVRVRNSYTLGVSSLFLRVSTEVVNESESAVDNLNIWVGTGDDYVGWVDSPTKQKGTLTDGAFVRITDAAEPAAALLITSASEGALFYSTTPGANSSINHCCSFSNAYNVQPTSSPITLTGDGSYAVNVPAGTVAPGGSASLTWFYAAGSLAQLNDVAAQVAAAAAPSAAPGFSSATVSWTAPDSSDPITNYALRWSDDSQTWTDVPLRDPSTATDQVVSGLTNGTSYVFQVAAITGTAPDTTQHGWSPSSAPVTPGVARAPEITAVTAGDSQVTLEFTDAVPFDPDAPVTSYEYQVGSGEWTATDPATAASPITVTGLANGVSQTFRVRGINAHGGGIASDGSTGMPVGPPPAATYVDAEQDGEGAISVWWELPSNGGSAITDYLVDISSDNGGTWTAVDDGVSTDAWTTVEGLVTGTSYRFRIRGVNALGTGTSRAMSYDVTLVELPGPPADLVVVPGDSEADTSWAQSETGGTAVEWVVEVSDDGGESWWEYDWTSDPSMYLELDNGTSYLVRVAGWNDGGQGEWTESEAFVPGIVPGSPSDVVATAGDTVADLEWIAPEDQGTSDVTTYVVELSTDDGDTWTEATATVDGTSAHVTGLTNGVEHLFRVSAVNDTGAGDPSPESNGVTPNRAWAPPSTPTADYPSAMRLRVGTAMTVRPTVTLPGAATGYVVTSSSLPVGVALDARTGTLRGTPLAQGTWHVRIGVRGLLGTVVSSDTVTFTVTGGYLVRFAPGSSELSQTARATLRVAARAVKACAGCTLEVRGYAAYVNGGVAAAKLIARQRATVVRSYLRYLGVGSAVTVSIGVGYATSGTADSQRKAVVTLHRPTV